MKRLQVICVSYLLISSLSIGGEPPAVSVRSYNVLEESGETVEFPYVTEVAIEHISEGAALVLLAIVSSQEEAGNDFVEVKLALIVKNNDAKRPILFPKIKKRYELEVSRVERGSAVITELRNFGATGTSFEYIEIKPLEIAIQHLSIKVKRDEDLKAVGFRLGNYDSNFLTNWTWMTLDQSKRQDLKSE